MPIVSMLRSLSAAYFTFRAVELRLWPMPFARLKGHSLSPRRGHCRLSFFRRVTAGSTHPRKSRKHWLWGSFEVFRKSSPQLAPLSSSLASSVSISVAHYVCYRAIVGASCHAGPPKYFDQWSARRRVG